MCGYLFDCIGQNYVRTIRITESSSSRDGICFAFNFYCFRNDNRFYEGVISPIITNSYFFFCFIYYVIVKSINASSG